MDVNAIAMAPPPPKRPRRLQRPKDAQSCSHHQQQPPGEGHAAGGGVDVDLALHDDVLGSIITLLPTKDGARTQILSRRWRPLWRSPSAPLNVEATVAATPLPPAVVGALDAHPGPARRVSLTWLASFHAFPMLDAMLHPGPGHHEFPCLDTLQEFQLHYKPAGAIPAARRHAPPMSALLRFAPTLRVLTICCAASCHSPNPYRLAFPPETDAACRALEFPCLERLTLKHVAVSGAALLSRCTALQTLVLHKNVGYAGRLVIRSPTLRNLGVSDDAAEVVVEDAPLLERLVPRDLWNAIRIQVIHAPRLKTIGYLCDEISEFEMESTVLKVQLNLQSVSKRASRQT